jgi:hypothetical protein
LAQYSNAVHASPPVAFASCERGLKAWFWDKSPPTQKSHVKSAVCSAFPTRNTESMRRHSLAFVSQSRDTKSPDIKICTPNCFVAA